MWRVQEPQLFEDQEQEDDHWSSGVQQVLPFLQEAHAAQRNQVVSRQYSAFSHLRYCLWLSAESRVLSAVLSEGERGASAGPREQSARAKQRSVAEPLKQRGVSSTVKLPVSKTGLGGSNPSAPARIDDGGMILQGKRKQASKWLVLKQRERRRRPWPTKIVLAID
jgi:hypothetical protein